MGDGRSAHLHRRYYDGCTPRANRWRRSRGPGGSAGWNNWDKFNDRLLNILKIKKERKKGRKNCFSNYLFLITSHWDDLLHRVGRDAQSLCLGVTWRRNRRYERSCCIVRESWRKNETRFGVGWPRLSEYPGIRGGRSYRVRLEIRL